MDRITSFPWDFVLIGKMLGTLFHWRLLSDWKELTTTMKHFDWFSKRSTFCFTSFVLIIIHHTFWFSSNMDIFIRTIPSDGILTCIFHGKNKISWMKYKSGIPVVLRFSGLSHLCFCWNYTFQMLNLHCLDILKR